MTSYIVFDGGRVIDSEGREFTVDLDAKPTAFWLMTDDGPVRAGDDA